MSSYKVPLDKYKTFYHCKCKFFPSIIECKEIEQGKDIIVEDISSIVSVNSYYHPKSEHSFVITEVLKNGIKVEIK
jgi:hypothetical protein